MSVVPTSKPEFIQFCTDHTGVWTASATQIGLTSAQVLAWSALAEEAKQAFDNAMIAHDNAKSATMRANEAIAGARTKTSELVRKIKDYATTTGNPNVYALANIPAPQNPSTLPPPGQCTDLRAVLDPNGSLTIRWKCVNPKGGSGTFYTVRRRIGDSGAFSIIGGSGSKSFIDNSIPAGSPRITYIVNGQRGIAMGPASSEFTVNFGFGGGGGLTILNTFVGRSEGNANGSVRLAA